MGQRPWKAAPANRRILCFFFVLCVFLCSTWLPAQHPTGTVTGVVTDPTGAVVAHAGVSVVNKATNLQLRLTTTAAGAYTASGLLPGVYEVRIEAQGFRMAVLELKVEVGRVTTADVRLQIGSASEAVTVRADEVRVNTTQSALEGVITEKLIRDLPLNGRNFLDLGQLEPGMQLNAAEWQSRIGFVRLATAGQSGVTTRVTVDGVDVSDENFGSVTAGLSLEAIKEFQVSRSNFDPATGLTGSAAVNVVTRGGSNDLHGSAFLFWRDDTLAARIAGESAPFDREQFGFSLGGPFVRDRLFWFAAYERNNQDAAASTNVPGFPLFSRSWQVPYDESMALGRLDWNATGAIRFFSRFSHHWNDGLRNLGGQELRPVTARNRTNQTAVGMEVSSGRLTHSFRFGYTNYDNVVENTVDRIPGFPLITDSNGRPVTVSFGAVSQSSSGAVAIIGPSGNSPARRYQNSYELRYDGGYSFGRHALRWGTLANFIRLNWFEPINAYAPLLTLTYTDAKIATCAALGQSEDIRCYPVQSVVIGNGLGFWTEVPSHGLPYGGILNNRFHWYMADSWRVSPRLTLNFGLRWVYEPGPDNPDLEKPADYLNGFMPGLGAAARRDRNNFAPQVGIAWDPTGSGKWAVRAAAGVFYDANLLKHVIFERNNMLPLGITNETASLLVRPARDPLTGLAIPATNLALFIDAHCAWPRR